MVQWLTTFKVVQRLLKGKSTQMGFAHWSLAVTFELLRAVYAEFYTESCFHMGKLSLCSPEINTYVQINSMASQLVWSQSWSCTQLPQVWWWNLKTSVEFSVKSETSCFQQLNHYWYTLILHFFNDGEGGVVILRILKKVIELFSRHIIFPIMSFKMEHTGHITSTSLINHWAFYEYVSF